MNTSLLNRKNRNSKGFSLIELLIVVAIILVIAAIAIPSLLRAKMRASETSAVGSLKAINVAQVEYSTTYGVGFANSLGALATPVGGCVGGATVLQACLLDSNLGSGTKSGYEVGVVASGGGGIITNPYQQFDSIAKPTVPGSSGISTFCGDESGVLRSDPTGALFTSAVPQGCAGSSAAPVQ